MNGFILGLISGMYLPMPKLLFFALFFLGLNVYSADKICDHIIIQDGQLKLNGNEKILVCGTDSGPEEWQKIPLAQAQLHLKTILQSVGYLYPKFETDGKNLLVWRGQQSQISALKITGDRNLLQPEKKRKVLGHPLTPAKLDEVTAWANLDIHSRGFACAEIKVIAQSWDGAVIVETNLGERKKISGLTARDLKNINPDIFYRYQPFEIGEVYDIRKTQIMTDRVLADGLFQSAFFEKKCDDENVYLDLKTTVGPPRIFRFGIGASTEELPFADLSFRNTRLDDQASSVVITLHASPRLLSFNADSELYWFPGWHRFFFAPRFKIARETESSYQSDTSRTGADLGVKWDHKGVRYSARGGPSLNTVKTLRGVGPKANYQTLDASISLTHFLYESSVWQQDNGWTGNFLFRGQRKGLGSEINLNRYEINAKYLWNIGKYSPPLFVLGTRVQGITVRSDEDTSLSSATLIPAGDRIFAGGDQNLRGFSRQSLDNLGLGYLSFLYLGFELRLIEELAWRIQPFLLFDIGQLGTRADVLDSAIYTSEGIGLRWPSPFGTLRGTLAHGRVANNDSSLQQYPEQWVLFLSFGQEF